MMGRPGRWLLRRPAMGVASILVLLFALAGLAACASGPTAGSTERTAVDGPRLTFQEREHDFGQVSASQTEEYRFAFANTGNTTVQISDVQPAPAKPGG